MERTPRFVTATAAAMTLLLSSSCGRTIEEEAHRELVEHRIEPCRQFCMAMQSPDCGRTDEVPLRTVDECVEDCADADPGNGFEWGQQEDGTDACVTEWLAASTCMDALTCEEQRAYFRRTTAIPDDWPCKDEWDVRRDCNRTPREDGG